MSAYNHLSFFYQDLYLSTQGFIPFWPLGEPLRIGDLFLFRSKRMIKLGNIADPYFQLREYIKIRKPGYHPMHYAWQLDRGVKTDFKGAAIKHYYKKLKMHPSKQGLMVKFGFPGAYFFRTSEIVYHVFENYYDLSYEILQRLASEKSNFREIFMVTETAMVKNFSLGIARGAKSRFFLNLPEITVIPTLDILNKPGLNYKVEHIRNMDTLYLDYPGENMFFRAKKIALSSSGHHRLQKFIQNNFSEDMQRYTSNLLDYAQTSILPSNDLYPGDIHEYFHFRPMNMSDIEHFLGNGHVG